MDAEVVESIHQHAISEYPNEMCGLICVIKGRERFIACKNIASSPATTFELDARDYVAAEDKGEVIAVVHSHPNASAQPSEADRVSCELTGLTWHIVSVRVDAQRNPVIDGLRTIEPNGYEAPLIGRQYVHGLMDCWTFCRDWYKQTSRLTLPDPERADEWWNDGESDLYSERALNDAGFYQVDECDLQFGDLIVMEIQSDNRVPNHGAIYLGDDMIAHHLYRRLSSRDVYSGFYHSATRRIMRHKDFRHD